MAGLDLVPDLTGALYIPDYRAVLVADLHFEKGSSRAARGVHLPPYDTRSSLDLLQIVLDRCRPQRLICLGDSFHDAAAPGRLQPGDLTAIQALSDQAEVIWITGNHDPDVPGWLGGRVVGAMALGAVTLRHIPEMDAGCEIAGHLHPCATVIRRGRKLRRKCFAADTSRLILPAFGAYTGGLNVLSPPFAGLFDAANLKVWMLGRDAIYRVPSKRLL